MPKNLPQLTIRLKASGAWLSVIATSGRLGCVSSSPPASHDVYLLAPFRRRQQDPWPRWSRDISHWRYRIDTLFGQLVECTAVKRIWAHDLWHLTRRLLRKMCMQTSAIFTNSASDRPPLPLADLVTENNSHIGLM